MTVRPFAQQEDWDAWLEDNHGSSPGLWLQIAKAGTGIPSVSYDQALETALCFGWIDGQKKKHDDRYWLQRFTPRSKNSAWSRNNREKALALIASGRMKEAGLREIEAAKRDGRWDAAYDSASKAAVPADFQAALDGNARARDFFAGLDSRNRYALLYRIQTSKKAETRARKIAEFVQMLERHEKIHP
ncbi:MAG TPA: YdeI/OmpD-associated family protein [Mariprofundaceae bacterium]|nr:YdeI/OmpD-associated family protein [Mariprofundaceae bacterium]